MTWHEAGRGLADLNSPTDLAEKGVRRQDLLGLRHTIRPALHCLQMDPRACRLATMESRRVLRSGAAGVCHICYVLRQLQQPLSGFSKRSLTFPLAVDLRSASIWIFLRSSLCRFFLSWFAIIWIFLHLRFSYLKVKSGVSEILGHHVDSRKWVLKQNEF